MVITLSGTKSQCAKALKGLRKSLDVLSTSPFVKDNQKDESPDPEGTQKVGLYSTIIKS